MINKTAEIMNRNFFILIFLFLGFTAFAQDDSKYGNTPEEQQQCKEYLSLYREYRDQKLINDAISPWRGAWQTCPQSAKTIYIDGVSFYSQFIEEAKDDTVRRNGLVDTLMMIYDDRIKHFGQEGFVLGLKGNDLFKYRPEKVTEANAMLKRSLELEGNNADAVVVSRYYQTLFEMYKNNEATKSDLLVEYMPVVEILDYNIQNADSKDSLRYESAKKNLDAFFIKIAECEDIYNILKESIDKDPDNIDLYKKALNVMNRRDCTENDLYPRVAEKVYQDNPTPDAAYSIGIEKLKSKDFNEAAKYFQEAIDLCNNCVNKRNYYLRAGQTASILGQLTKTRTFANKMLELNSNDGDAYILLGDAIAASAKSCDDGKLGNVAVYWLAVDYYNRAKAKDPSIAEKANQKISSYSRYFPSKQDAFFHDLKDGDSYTLECLGETTTVRTI